MLVVLKIIFYICISELTISLERPIQKTPNKPTTSATCDLRVGFR